MQFDEAIKQFFFIKLKISDNKIPPMYLAYAVNRLDRLRTLSPSSPLLDTSQLISGGLDSIGCKWNAVFVLYLYLGIEKVMVRVLRMKISLFYIVYNVEYIFFIHFNLISFAKL